MQLHVLKRVDSKLVSLTKNCTVHCDMQFSSVFTEGDTNTIPGLRNWWQYTLHIRRGCIESEREDGCLFFEINTKFNVLFRFVFTKNSLILKLIQCRDSQKQRSNMQHARIKDDVNQIYNTLFNFWFSKRVYLWIILQWWEVFFHNQDT